jgi:hypothetical protein
MRPPRLGHLSFGILAATLGVVALTIAGPGTAWAADMPIPAGFSVTARDRAGDGVEHLVLTKADPPMVVNVAHITAGAPVSLRAVLSNDTVAGAEPRLETTSAMCARVHCLVGVNADFFSENHEPLGAFVTDGELLRSPSTTHHQLSLTSDGRITDDSFGWSGRLMTTDLKQLNFDGVNVERPAGKVVLYTPAFGATTGTGTPGVDLVLRVVEPAGEFRLGQTALVEAVALNDGAVDGPVPPGGAVLSADGAGGDGLRALWARVTSGAASNQALLRIESTGVNVRESVGGSPILVKDGKRWFTDPGDNFTVGRHPRTLVGWTPGGDTLLVTVDGRQPGVSVGMTLYEATDLLIGLGATEGMNLDGGGSTTFVRGGGVVNKVSDVQVKAGGKTLVRHTVQKGDTLLGHVERGVASALVVVPSIAVSVPPVDPFAGAALGLREQALALPGGTSSSPWVSASAGRSPSARATTSTLAAGDPASAPDGRLPALVGPRPAVGAPLIRAAVLLVGLALVVVACAGVLVRRRGSLRLRRRLVPAAVTADASETGNSRP